MPVIKTSWEAVPAWLNSTMTVIAVKGTIELKCSVENGVNRINTRNPIFQYKWHDQIDARSFDERKQAEPGQEWPDFKQTLEGIGDKFERMLGADFWVDISFGYIRKSNIVLSQDFDADPIK